MPNIKILFLIYIADESLLEMSVEKMVDVYLDENQKRQTRDEELQHHYQIGRSIIRVSKEYTTTSSPCCYQMDPVWPFN